ncbi:terpenoid synthase [Athelia psychrophila]|uniref:Terpenoid synthase n=1 Tax=Athelia psychrophila TaxID=1759441 RepID=A0A166FMR2_9AGAM|nr:terpenoid synthase [Fibularhizoctonia sp. CBS 109695]
MESCGDIAIADGFEEDFIRSSQFQTYLRLGTVANAVFGTFIVVYLTRSSECVGLSAHLKDYSTQQWICLFSAFTIYFDDILEKDASMVREFQQRFLAGRPQEYPLLDQFAAFVRKVWIHFHPTCANLIVTSILDWITGFLIEADYSRMEVHERAVDYPQWMRRVIGGARAYAFFVFPPEMPFEHYIQVISDMQAIIDDVNDLLSFYKEELRGETTNQVSLMSQLEGKTKIESLSQLSEGCIQRIQRSCDVLSSHQEAYDIFRNHFLSGYVKFYIREKRYKLIDLDLA